MRQIEELTSLPTSNNINEDIRSILAEARRITARAVNTAMVTAYWLIGKRIVLEEQKGQDRANYGENLLKNLSKELTAEFGNGFSYSNLYNMRLFYQTYTDAEKFYTLCINLSWSHNRLIMRVSDANAREWYLREAASANWSVRELERNINSFYYQRHLESGSVKSENATQCVANSDVLNPRQLMKDPYVLEFVGLPQSPEHSEHDLEEALITHLQEFMLELGKGFSFVKRQYRISTETSHFYIDLVFYNYILKCFFLVDLKADKLTHQDVGQMDMYVRMFDDIKRGEGDNPTIGLLLCAERDETVVKYSVLNDSQQIFASKYLPYLPTEEELKREIENAGRMLQNKEE
ncbi:MULTISPECIES: YhcG family protein [unclassified Bacteroides]|jgi:predicted nuclease of restriction endonuclease-like (RecB) superfamily|uniref:PDDEXK nuclease domain-containing protein n=1 Tax=unclassified Bacteroides TaxID=2646097 RepID=UPI000691142C|nr:MULTISPECIES: PDDEXK nuclease domain-containing protein [unclassified Bacteroides]